MSAYVPFPEIKKAHYQKIRQDLVNNLMYPPLVTSEQPKKESDMNIAANAMSTITTELPGKREKDYLLSRLDCLAHEHDNKLREEFHLDDEKPRTPRELYKMLKDGHYELNEKKMETYRDHYYGPDANEEDVGWGYSLFEYITLRNPKHKKDKEGYKKATEKLNNARQKTKDTIIVKSPDDGLLALEAFESQTFH